MEVRKGYKQTEVGVIPEDWELVTLGDVAEIKMCKRIFAEQTSINGDIPFYKIGTFGKKPDAYISEFLYKEYKSNYSFPRKGDILLSAAGTLGRTVVYDGEPSYYQDSNIVWLDVDKNRISNKYLFQYYIIIKWASPEGSTISRLYNGIIRKTKILLPPLTEQEAIAEALSDADALIESLEALLAKKRQVKQGAMSELLSGKRRLPEFEKKKGYKQTPSGVFPEDWDVVPLRQISSMHGRIGWQGLKQTEFTMNADEPFLITGMNFKDGEIRWDEVYHVPWERYEMAKEIQLKTGDILMTKDGTIGKMLFVDEIPNPGKATLNSHLLVFRPLNNKYIPKFLFYQMQSKAFFNHIEQEKSGTTFFGITQAAVGKYNVFLPSLAEQNSIAEILSDMDEEIRALEGKLSKARAVKAGMMSVLLTGRVRLV